MRKPSTVSSRVTAICCHKGPWAVPCVAQVTSWAQMPEGCPQKNLSMIPTRVASSQPPMMTTSSPTRRLLTRMRLLRRATAGEGPAGLSGVVRGALDALLIALIANEYLLSQIFPDALIELDETWLEADFLHLAWPRQVDAIDALHGSWSSRQDAHPVRQGDGLFQVVGDEDHRGLVGRPQSQQFVFHQGARLH